jgi:hypothetical protein
MDMTLVVLCYIDKRHMDRLFKYQKNALQEQGFILTHNPDAIAYLEFESGGCCYVPVVYMYYKGHLVWTAQFFSRWDDLADASRRIANIKPSIAFTNFQSQPDMTRF